MEAPTLKEIAETHARLIPYVKRTPTWHWDSRLITQIVGPETSVFLKLEIFQRTGSFKPRGALVNIMSLDEAALRRGVTAVSAGNHAIGVAFAASLLGTHAKLVMPRSTSKIRVEICEAFGAEVVLSESLKQAYIDVSLIENDEGRYLVHQFEGPNTVKGTATLGYEWMQQVPNLDAIIIPIGGGGLCAGISQAVRYMNPGCKIYAVEPEGSDVMRQSFTAGSPQHIDSVDTIAKSLGVLRAMPYSMEICQRNVDELVLISDEEMQKSMALLFHSMKLAVEPAGAAATAALTGPLLEKVRGKRVGVIVCGTNIDSKTFSTLINGF